MQLALQTSTVANCSSDNERIVARRLAKHKAQIEEQLHRQQQDNHNIEE
jgi:hypothetical protein